MREVSFPLQLELAELRGRALQVFGVQDFEGARGVHLRQVACYVLARAYGLPRGALVEMLAMGPSNVDYAIKTIAARMEAHAAFRIEIEALVAALKPPGMRRVEL